MSEKPEDREQKTENTRHSTQIASRLILLIAIVIAVCVFIIRNFDVSINIILVLLGFGAFILIHELGHFIVAKLCGIKVEAFSIGFPPILLGIKKADRGWKIRILPELLKSEGENSEDGLLGFAIGKKILPGETEYRIGLIPFGGFVKMLGQEDVGPVKSSADPRSFSNKPAMVRAAVLAAGVTFNVISAVIMFMIVFLIGIGLPSPIVGGVVPGSPAEKAGLRPGDEIIKVAGNSSRLDFSDIMMAAVLSGKGEAVPMEVKRADGTIEDVSIIAEQLPGGQFRSFGIQKPSTLKIAQLPPADANLLYSTTGLKPGDVVKAVEGVDVNYNWQVEPIIEGIFEPNILILAQRRDSAGKEKMAEGHIPISFLPTKNLEDAAEANLSSICGMVPRLRIIAANKSFGERLREWLGLKKKRQYLEPGDIIAAAADEKNPTYADLREITEKFDNGRMPMTVIRSEPNGTQRRLTVEVFPKADKTGRVIIGIVVDLDAEDAVVAKTIATQQQPNLPAIPRGATITAVDGVEVKNFYDIARQLKHNSGQHVTVDWRLDAQKAGNAVVNVGEKWGVVSAYAFTEQSLPFAEMERLYKANGPVDAIGMGYKRTKTFIIQTYVTLQRLIGGLVSPKQLMGPVGILAFSYRIVSDHPFVYYVYFLGLISASIAVLNFLPLPPFDGGLTVLLLVEKIKGSAISVRTQEILAYVGWGMVGTLFLYVTFNDIGRLIFGFFS